MTDQNNNEEQLLKHEYDGIRELDNPLPMWWLATFFITIIFSALYWLHYETSKAGLSTSEELTLKMDVIESQQAKSQAAKVQVSENDLKALIGDTSAMDAAKAEYQSKCAACHGSDGGGLIGPNLTDRYWKNGNGSLVSIHEILFSGVTEKGMPAWKGLITDPLLEKLSAYVGSLKGTTPTNAKPPEGQEY